LRLIENASRSDPQCGVYRHVRKEEPPSFVDNESKNFIVDAAKTYVAL
jgi:hypothetical protein